MKNDRISRQKYFRKLRNIVGLVIAQNKKSLQEQCTKQGMEFQDLMELWQKEMKTITNDQIEGLMVNHLANATINACFAELKNRKEKESNEKANK